MSEQAMNKLEAYYAHLEEERQRNAAKRAERDKWMAQVQANRDRFAQTGEPAAPPPTLNEVFKARKQRLDEEHKETRRAIVTGPYALNPYTLPMPPHVIQAQKRAYFDALNAAEEEA